MPCICIGWRNMYENRRCRRRKIGKPFNLNKRQRYARLFGVTNHILNLVTISSLSFEHIIYCIIQIE